MPSVTWMTSRGRWTPLFLLGVLAACQARPHRRFVFSADAPTRTGLVSTEGAGADAPVGALMGDEAGTLLLLGPSGAPRWHLELGKEIAAAPVVTPQGIAVAGTVGGDWVGVEVRSGRTQWRLTEQPPPAAFASDGSRVFVVTQDGAVRALHPLSGETLWKRARPIPGGGAGPAASLQVFPGLVAVRLGEQLFALRAADGSVVWRSSRHHPVGMLASEGRLLITTGEGKLLSLEPATGAIQTVRPVGTKAVSAPCAAASRVWVGLEDGVLASFELNTLAPEARRALSAPMTGCPTFFQGYLAVPTDGPQGRLELFLDGSFGPAFSLRLDSPLRSAPLGIAERLWVPSRDGRVTAYQLPPPVHEH